MLAGYVRRTAFEPFEWGKNDCALWCAGACEEISGIDPASDLRGTYSTRRECLEIVKRAGGLVPLIAPRMERTGFSAIDGNGIAVVRIHGWENICAILVDGRAIAKTARGLLICDNFSIIRGWSWSRQ